MVLSEECDALLLAPRNLTFTKEQEEYRQRLRQFILTEVKPKLSQWEMKGKVDKQCFQKAAELGFYCQNIPKEYGGAGLLDFRHNIIVTEELESFDCGSVFFPLGSTCYESLPLLIRFSQNVELVF